MPAHAVPDGSPHVSLPCVGLDGDELLVATLFDQPKLRNLRRDPRIAVSFVTGGRNPMGLDNYLALHGPAPVTEGGAPEIIAALARTFLGPNVVFPPMPNPPPGFVTRITVDRISSLGPGSPAGG